MDVRDSKMLVRLLRHTAEDYGLMMTEDGYLYVDDIFRTFPEFRRYSEDDVIRTVRHNNKQRFELKDVFGRLMIRARQGHSLGMDVDIEMEELPTDCRTAFHGTSLEAWKTIRTAGLSRMRRQHIHMASGVPGGAHVISGMRHDVGVIITIDVAKARTMGLEFVVSENGVIPSSGDDDGVICPCFFRAAIRKPTSDGLTWICTRH